MANNLQNKILNTLNGSRNVKDIDSVLSDLKNLQNKLIKNYSDINFSDKGKNQILKRYNDLETIGKFVYKYKILSQNNLSEAAKEQANNASNLVLKGGISNVRYVWQTEPNACEECQALDGTEYESEDEIPEKSHENCQCYIEIVHDEEIDDEPCDCWDKIDEIVEEANTLDDELISDMSDVDSIQAEVENWLVEVQELKVQVEQAQEELENTEPCGPDCVITGMATNITDDKGLEDTVYNLIKDIEEARVVYEIFQSNKHEMETTANSFDKYYHAKANCESAELGTIEAMWAVLFSVFKEVKDYFKKVFSLHMDAKKVFLDCMNDLRADLYGLKKAKEHGYCSNKVKDVGNIFHKN